MTTESGEEKKDGMLFVVRGRREGEQPEQVVRDECDCPSSGLAQVGSSCSMAEARPQCDWSQWIGDGMRDGGDRGRGREERL